MKGRLTPFAFILIAVALSWLMVAALAFAAYRISGVIS